jgi:hypothetical protein
MSGSRPPTALDVYLMDMLRAVEAGAQHSALALALTLPDICSSIECPIRKVGVRYRCWCDTWGKALSISGADCYALRCAYLHNGQDEFSGPSADLAPFERIEFTLGQVGGVWVSQALQPVESGAKQTARIPVETFRQSMAISADAWRRARENDPRVAAAIAGLMWMRPAADLSEGTAAQLQRVADET